MDEQLQHYKSVIEALLFVSEKPVLIGQLKEVLPELGQGEIQGLVKQLQDEYVNRQSGMVVLEIAGGFQMLSNSQAEGYIREFYKTKIKEKLSRPALESLAIIAYKQPAGRAEVEMIRGVNSDGTIAHLLNKGLIKIVGRKEVPGRPFLYGTTKAFLEYFGLKALEDLPKMEEFNQLGLEVPSKEASAVSSEGAIEAQLPVVGADVLPVEDHLISAESLSQENSGQSRIQEESKDIENIQTSYLEGTAQDPVF